MRALGQAAARPRREFLRGTQPLGAFPPAAGRAGDALAAHERAHRIRHRGRLRRAGRSGERVDAVFGHAVGAAQERLPIDHAERRPRADGPHVGTRGAGRRDVLGVLREPAHAFALGGMDMDFAQRERESQPFPGRLQERSGARRGLVRHIDRGDVADPTAVRREEVALGMHVVIEGDQIRRRRRRAQLRQFALGELRLRQQIRGQRVRVVDAPRHQLHREEDPFAQERRVRGDALAGGREALQIVGQYELRLRRDAPDPLHRELLRARFVQERPAERRVVAQVGIPHAVERREARRRQRFVDRRPAPDPRKPAGDTFGIVREAPRKGGIEQIGVERPRAMMQQRHDRLDAARPQPFEAQRGPIEIVVFPQDRKTGCCDLQIGNQIDIAQARAKARLGALIAHGRGADPSDARFGRRPDLDHSIRREPVRAVCRARSRDRSCGRRESRPRVRCETRRTTRRLRRMRRVCGSTRR